jgi:hypothetical protein
VRQELSEHELVVIGREVFNQDLIGVFELVLQGAFQFLLLFDHGLLLLHEFLPLL